MFKKILPLDARLHAELRVEDTSGWSFAAKEMLVPVMVTEMSAAAREYPLVFMQDRQLVYALTGIEQDVNAYVTDDGRWQATYIPARLRNYPFMLVAVPGKPGEFAIAVDADAPQLGSAVGHLVFENSQLAPYMQQRLEHLKFLQQAEPMTRNLVNVIRDAGLLTEKIIRIRHQDGKERQLKGIQVVDEKKLNQMPHDQFAALRDKGALPLIYAHLLSMANLHQGPLAGKYPQLAQKQEQIAADVLQSGTIRLN